MQIGMVGLGKMGGGMAKRLLRGDHDVIGFDPDQESRDRLDDCGGRTAETLEQLVDELSSPRLLWMMVPAGEVVDQTLEKLCPLLDEGDVVVDGGNSNYKDTLRRADEVDSNGIRYADVGTSGGVWGIDQGFSMMVGGADDTVEFLRPALETLAPGPGKGWGHVGGSGAGHYVKMIHNGVEYALMQAYAEGFALLEAKDQFDFDLHQVAEIWRYGSVIRSWLLDLTAAALEDDATLSDIAPWVDDSGEGRWTVAEAVENAVATPTIAVALMRRFASRDDVEFADRLLAAMRNQFGGHATRSTSE